MGALHLTPGTIRCPAHEPKLFVMNYIHFEITGASCILIGSQQQWLKN